MPTYEYRCPDGHDFEQFVQKMSDGLSELPCPDCGKVAGRRMSAGGGLLFKGSGFYITDYGREGKRDQGDSGAAQATATAKSAAAKSEASATAGATAGAGSAAPAGTKSDAPAKPAAPAAPAPSSPPKSSGSKE